MVGLNPGYSDGDKRRIRDKPIASWILKGWVETGKGLSHQKSLRKTMFLFIDSTSFKPKVKVLGEERGDRTGKCVKEVKQEKD